MINPTNHAAHISTLIQELELAVFTARLTRTEKNKIILKLLRLQHTLGQK
jgi:hypothetical protein